MNNITWRYVSEKKITDKQIQQVEQYFGIKFPYDFIECVKRYDGGYPTPKVFDIPGQSANVFNDLLTFHIEDEYSIVQNYEEISDGFVDKVYPFANDPFGNFLCFDYRNSPASPTIVFWDHEEELGSSIYYVAASFEEFLSSLREYEEEED
jgi:cell wall assembly regulator SMI1